MRPISLFTRFFIATVFTTITSLAIAAFSASKAYDADPQLIAKLEEKFNVKVHSGNLMFSATNGNFEHTEDQWQLNVPKSKLSLKTFSGNIAVKNTNDSKIKITATGRVDRNISPKLLTISETNDELMVTEAENAARDLEVRIEIPTAYNQEFELLSVSGDVSAEGLNVTKADISTVSGEITLNGFTTPNLKIETISGDAKVRNSSIMKQVSGKSVSGEIEIENIQSADANLKSISGGVKLKMPKNNTFQFNLKSISGDIQNSHATDPKSQQDAKLSVEISTTSGDIKIE